MWTVMAVHVVPEYTWIAAMLLVHKNVNQEQWSLIVYKISKKWNSIPKYLWVVLISIGRAINNSLFTANHFNGCYSQMNRTKKCVSYFAWILGWHLQMLVVFNSDCWSTRFTKVKKVLDIYCETNVSRYLLFLPNSDMSVLYMRHAASVC